MDGKVNPAVAELADGRVLAARGSAVRLLPSGAKDRGDLRPGNGHMAPDRRHDRATRTRSRVRLADGRVLLIASRSVPDSTTAGIVALAVGLPVQASVPSQVVKA